MAFKIKKLLKRLPMPGGTAEKYGTVGKIGAALSGFAPAMMDPDVVGARGSAQNLGRSVDQAKDKAVGVAGDIAQQQQVAAAAAAAAAEEPFNIMKSSQLQALKRKGRRASILTSAQGATDSPLGIPG